MELVSVKYTGVKSIPNGKKDDVKSCSTIELVENALDSFLGSIKAKCGNSIYDLRP